ncbi:uncharacterized protein VTP21DRAFT_4185 [Calcarisporiella thermophila]|uniref:uncharacterized protein n=1 Tax=Calcarisporiella thermophila TaxID=911321 RepID=UPI003742F89F
MEASSLTDQRFEDVQILDEITERFGFYRYLEGPEKLGWLINMHATLRKDPEWPGGRAGVDYYFLEEDGSAFKCTLIYSPYFLIACRQGTENDVEEYLRKRFDRTIEKMTRVLKEDLKMPNHLLGYRRTFIKLSFRNVQDLLSVRKIIMPVAKKNEERFDAVDAYADVISATTGIEYERDTVQSLRKGLHDALDNIIDIREYDVPYYLRVAIDNDIRVGYWYNCKAEEGQITLKRREDLVKRAEPVVLAFDIETTKLPLKFPDASIDSIMMISYMVDGQGYLITNRDIVSQDIDDFEYTPKPEFEGPFTIFNEPDESAVIRRFFEHIQELKPTVVVSYNGDMFDWPFVEARARVHGIDMYHEIGFYKDDQDEYKCKHTIHMDCLRWVKRDSYLPAGSHGLKAVTTSKLGYNPMELDPEDMTRFASERPQTLAQYSVSDAVATYYLYMKYVHPFIFSLCNIIPLNPDEVLRKGSGTLCEMLLMVEAYKAHIIMPNKHTDELIKFHEGHLLSGETYVGGHVEALEAGVFRSDIPCKFKIVPEACQQLIEEVDAALKFSFEEELKVKLEDIADYNEVRAEIVKKLEDLRDKPDREECPLIYHLDVAAMYPNIILTNRLQPDAIVNEAVCATCDFNRPGKTCDRRLTWSWRGEFFPAKRSEFNMIRSQLETEKFPGKRPNDVPRMFNQLSASDQATLLHKRLGEYSRKAYKKMHEVQVIEKEAIICQRENPFYVDTVRAFRDRRYEYKGLLKTWKKNVDKAVANGDLPAVDEAKKMIVLYDSLQLAHKCILNSFYGYVMRKGSRWFSMEMAGVVCLTGAKIIQMARQLVDQVGRPLELDTDGIWCILPRTFPENFTFKLHSGRAVSISYPCTVLNHRVHARFTNNQYQLLVDPATFTYETRTENSIFFEVDGPYRAMILPSSKDEDKLLKKRYAVFNDDGSLAELKGFEVKRRGELKLIKIFQSQIFKIFLQGSTLEECYAAVAKVANQWLDVLESKAANLPDEEVFDLISENRSMSKTLEEYGSQKSTSISTARRLAEFLGDQMVKDKGLACKFIISAKPAGAPVAERAIPTAIFSAEPSVKKFYLRKWLKDNALASFDIREILDWPYYMERLGSVIQKLITIPAAMQRVRNPVPRVKHPDWLFKRIAARDDKLKQQNIKSFVKVTAVKQSAPGSGDGADGDEALGGGGEAMGDIEDFGRVTLNGFYPQKPTVTRHKSLEGGTKETEAVPDPREEPLEEADKPENMPSMYEDYPAWLAFQKRKWHRQRKLREHRRKIFGTKPHLNTFASGAGGGVTSFFRKQAESLYTKHWQIIHIAETDTPGELRAWVLLKRHLHSIRLTVPRVFYVNSREERLPDCLQVNPAFRVERMVRTLPRSHPCMNLFKVTMSEAVYQQEQKRLSSFFNHPSTGGVYESQVSLLDRALLRLGCVCTVDRGARNLRRLVMDDSYELDDLTAVEPASKSAASASGADPSSSYLSDYPLNYLYLYHVGSDSRHCFALFSTATSRVNVAFVDRAATALDSLPNFAKIYRDRLADASQPRKKRAAEAFAYSDELEFQVGSHTTEKEALRVMQRALSQYQEEHRGPTVLVFHSAKRFDVVAEQCGILREFPAVLIPSRKADNVFPALDWQRHVARRMMTHYLHLAGWITERIALARHARVPMCNILGDSPVFLSDIMFARRLAQQEMILWWSPSARPDLGGREEDENLHILEELVNPELNSAGSYGTVCLEVEVGKLCVNAILEAPALNELEGTEGMVGFDASASQTLEAYGISEGNGNPMKPRANLGDSLVSAQMFGVLRSLVRGWHSEAEAGNRYSAMLLAHLQRWLTSTSANMRDPALYSLVHGLMKKVFVQLVAEFKRLGARAVYANFNRLIFATTKPTVESAHAYSRYIIKAIKTKAPFRELKLDFVQYWEQLLWMDAANYGGIVCNDARFLEGMPNGNGGGGEEGGAKREEGTQPTVVMRWDIKEYLPPGLQQSFQLIVAEFIFSVHKHRMERIRSFGSQHVYQARLALEAGADLEEREEGDGGEVGGENGGEDAEQLAKRKKLLKRLEKEQAEDEKADEMHYTRRLIREHFTRKILNIIPEIRKRQAEMGENPEAHAALSFPQLPGSHLEMKDPALEFVKFVCMVLSLDSQVSEAVRILRRNLLGQIGVREFSEEAKFRNPCASFRLEQVICHYCNLCRDLDFCRERESVWICAGCGTEYDRGEIEEAIVAEVQRWMMAYQLQDLRCGKCHAVKMANLNLHCACSGPYQTTQSRGEFARRIGILRNIARFHKLELLSEVVEWVQQEM